MSEKYEFEYCNLVNANEAGNKHSIKRQRQMIVDIRQLQADNERLRGALLPFANFACDDWQTHKCHNCIAKQALAKKEQKNG